MTRATVVYDRFDGGEWGTLGARKARPGMFTGSNVKVYRDGMIGPRPGVRDRGFTGIPSDEPFAIIYRDVASSEFVAVFDDDVYVAAEATNPSFSSAGSLAAVPDGPIYVNESVRQISGASYLPVYGDGLYEVDNTTATVISGAPNGAGVEILGDRLVGTFAGNSVFFSDASDFSTWDALNYFLVGYEYPLVALAVHRNGLSIFTPNKIFRLTGTLGVTDTLRLASTGLFPGFGNPVVIDGDSCLFVPKKRTGPVTWDGGILDDRSLEHLSAWTYLGESVFYGGTMAPRYRDVLFVSDGGRGATHGAATNPNSALLRSNGIWTFHTFGFLTSGALSRYENDKFLLLSYDATPKGYVLDMSLDRPGFTSDTYAQPGDGSDTPLTASFSLPEYWDPSGAEVRVRSVIVNATKYATGSGTNNNITLTVTALDRFGPSDKKDSASQTWSEAGTSATTTGKGFRWEPNFGDQGSGGGFQLAFSALKGVKIKDVVVVLDVFETRAA